MTLRPAVTDCEKVLSPRLRPLHRPACHPGRNDGEVILLSEVELAPESTTNEWRDDTDSGLRHIEVRGQLFLHQLWRLAR